MLTQSSRRFTWIDAVILAAGLAGGLALARNYYLYEWHVRPTAALAHPDLLYSKCVARALLILSFAVGLIRLRRPRPPLRQLFRQPGAAAIVGVAVCTAVEGLRLLPRLLGVENRPETFPYLSGIASWHLQTLGVACAWLPLIFTGTWRAEPHWIDRLGRLVGLTWVGLFVTNLFLALIRG